MSWDKIEGHYSPKDNACRISIINPSGFCAAYRIKVILGREVMKSLGWNIGCRVNMLLGTGKDAGLIRLELHERGRFKLIAQGRGSHGAAFFSSKALPVGVTPCQRDVQIAKHSTLDGSIEIEVPKRFYSTEIVDNSRNSVGKANKAKPSCNLPA